jgi:hypothetical protein
MATVAELLDQLENGETTLDDVVAEFAFVEWPEFDRKTTLDEIEADPDPTPDPPGGFALVAQAFADGRIDQDQYGTLATAFAEAQQ